MSPSIAKNAYCGLPFEDALTVNNLKHAWQYLLSHMDIVLDVDLVKTYNDILMDGLMLGNGKIRIQNIFITGTTYKPPLPSEESAQKLIATMGDVSDVYMCGMQWFMRLAKAQLFRNGNKRTAAMIANHYFVQRNLGLLVFPDSVVQGDAEFFRELIRYYESDDEERFGRWLLDNCFTDSLDMPA